MRQNQTTHLRSGACAGYALTQLTIKTLINSNDGVSNIDKYNQNNYNNFENYLLCVRSTNTCDWKSYFGSETPSELLKH